MENNIEKELGEQTAIVEKLREAVCTLNGKLRPITVVDDSTCVAQELLSSASIPKQCTMSPLAGMIKEHNSGLYASIDNLLTIIKNIDL